MPVMDMGNLNIDYDGSSGLCDGSQTFPRRLPTNSIDGVRDEYTFTQAGDTSSNIIIGMGGTRNAATSTVCTASQSTLRRERT
jgi:hypothetical protein